MAIAPEIAATCVYAVYLHMSASRGAKTRKPAVQDAGFAAHHQTLTGGP